MDTIALSHEEEVVKWVHNIRDELLRTFYNNFKEVDNFLVDIIKCTTPKEYIEVEKTFMKPDALMKPGKIPTSLNNLKTKVDSACYFSSVFLTKWAGETIRPILEVLLNRVKTTALKYERISAEHKEMLDEYFNLETKFADSKLENEKIVEDLEIRIRKLEVEVLAKEQIKSKNDEIVTNLENRIRNLEADIIAKEQIILEKNEINNNLWGKIKVLEEKKGTANG
ncbi:hypothetical protein RhiirA5_404468 [Rhizophagus irregularis]|uniref:Uncharacterized protein n=1 Tax=Rhizophagus irregularis TaxID=588596 RepID=A0A2N0NP82_9GLOM|nr:hypothetical protein RhiirA5_404468 [Rhizophagus irregularis]